MGFDSLLYNDRIGKVSLIGAGMRSHPGVSATFFGALAEAGVNIEMISTSEIRISAVVVDENDVNQRRDRDPPGLRPRLRGRGSRRLRRERPVSAGPGAGAAPGGRSRRPVLAVVGATGAVGTVMLRRPVDQGRHLG